MNSARPFSRRDRRDECFALAFDHAHIIDRDLRYCIIVRDRADALAVCDRPANRIREVDEEGLVSLKCVVGVYEHRHCL